MNTTDSYSAMLAAYKADRAATARFALSAPWALRSDGVEGVLIRMCTGAPYWIRVDGAEPVQVGPRDLAMLARGTAHEVASTSKPAFAPAPFGDLIAAHMEGKHGDHPLVFSHGEGGPVTEMYTLHIWLPVAGVEALLGEMPPLLILREGQTPMAAPLALAMESLVHLSIARHAGWQLSAARMADLLLAHLLGEYLASSPAVSVGVLRGLEDPGIARAITRMHDTPGHPWTLASLAAESRMSRSLFSERFRTLVGATPMQYLASYRMMAAAQALRQGRAKLYDIARTAGYESEKAFARAFRRWSGQTPGSVRLDRDRHESPEE